MKNAVFWDLHGSASQKTAFFIVYTISLYGNKIICLWDEKNMAWKYEERSTSCVIHVAQNCIVRPEWENLKNHKNLHTARSTQIVILV
jgi:hypothetical protein